MALRTPRHDFGPTASTSKYGISSNATPRAANPYGTASLTDTPAGARRDLGSSTNGQPAASAPHHFDFLSHPLYQEQESQTAGGLLQFDLLYSKMAAFKDHLDAFVEESVHRIEAATQTQAEVKDLYKKDTREIERDLEVERKTQHDLWTKISSEREEDAEARRVQSEKERYVHSLSSQLTDVQNELSELKKDLQSRKEERRKVANRLKEMTRLDVPEREMLEAKTGCQIDTPGNDLVSFTFSLLNPDQPRHEAFFVFAVSERIYSIPIVEPSLSDAALQGVLDELNKNRNAFKSIKTMRKLLKEQVMNGLRAQRTAKQAVDAAGLSSS
ncbi:unnamed protein product [Sympodiomycopsis kandeliae]